MTDSQVIYGLLSALQVCHKSLSTYGKHPIIDAEVEFITKVAAQHIQAKVVCDQCTKTGEDCLDCEVKFT